MNNLEMVNLDTYLNYLLILSLTLQTLILKHMGTN